MESEVIKWLWEGLKVIVFPLLGIIWLWLRNEMKDGKRISQSLTDKISDHGNRLTKLETQTQIELKNLSDQLNDLKKINERLDEKLDRILLNQ